MSRDYSLYDDVNKNPVDAEDLRGYVNIKNANKANIEDYGDKTRQADKTRNPDVSINDIEASINALRYEERDTAYNSNVELVPNKKRVTPYGDKE